MGFWKKFLLAFFPGRHYLDFMKEPSTTSFLYFLRLAFLVGFLRWVLTVGALQINIASFFGYLARHVPTFEIREGRVIAPFPQPFSLKLPFKGKLIIDTTGKVKLPPLDTRISFLVTRDQVLVQARGWFYRFALPHEAKVDASFWRKLGDLWVIRLTFLYLFWLLLYTLFTKFLHYVLASGYAMALEALWKLNLEYFQLLAVCIYALTPACFWGLAIRAIIGKWGGQLPFPYLDVILYYAFYVTFITFVLWLYRQEK